MGRVLIICSDGLSRIGIQTLLEDGGYDQIRGVPGIPEALNVVTDERPVLVLVVAEPDHLHRLRAFRAAAPEAKIVVLTRRQNPLELVQSLDADAQGYVLLDGDAPGRLFADLDRIRRGEIIIAGESIRRLAAAVPRQRLDPLVGLFTERELQVAGLLRRGATNTQISKRLFMSVGTVKNRVSTILWKLDVRNRGEAIAKLAALPEEAFTFEKTA